jgi:polysaccharide deacetylase family protein (PEP-CTERM system associated)
VTAPVFLASFDVEEWFHAENVKPYIDDADWATLESRVERNTHALLDILAETGCKSTFFVVGWVARRYPGLVRRMVDEGHEIGSHTDRHMMLARLPRDQVLDELTRSRSTLEELSGTRVLGVRSPNFSISDEVLDCMAEAGYWYDSSLFALRAHARYGRLSAEIDPDRPITEARGGLLELPMSRLPVGGATLPWAGGAYFRFIPYPIYRRGVDHRLGGASWFMFYFHPWELDPDEVVPDGMPLLRRTRSYAGRARTGSSLRKLLTEFGSQRIDAALRARGYDPPAPDLARTG